MRRDGKPARGLKGNIEAKPESKREFFVDGRGAAER